MKKKKWLLALTAATTGVLALGLVGCGGGGDDESSDEHGGKDPEETRREQIETLTGGVFSKADDALLMDSVHYSIRTGNSGNWDTVHLEKSANGFCFYQQNYVSDAKTAYIDSFSDEITYLTGVELSEETKSIVKKFNPYYFFTKDGSYYLQNKNGATGEIAQSVYEEVLAYVDAFTSNSVSALFNAGNFEISEHGTQLLQKQEGELTVNGKALTEAEWGFGLQEPTFELEMYVGGRFYEMIADYPVGVQEFVDYYMSEVFGDTEGVTTDGFGAKTEELTARQAQSEEFQITLPTYLYKTVGKIAAGNYRVKVTSTEKFYENFSDSTIATREYEYLYDDGNIKRTAGQEEIYFNTETKYTVETLGAKKIGYTAGETFAADFEKAAKFYTDSFMEYLNNTVVVSNLPTYNADKECFTKQWFYNSSLFGGLQGYPQVELTFNADKLVLNLKVADSSYSSQYKHFYTFEFDSFGQVDVEMPQVEKASVKDILDEIIATDTYNLISGNYPSVVENGQGAVYLPGEYNTTRLKADGEKYYAHTGEYNARKKYEITQDMYQSFLPRSSYVYGELFDYDHYTASGDGYAYSGKNFDGTATYQVDGENLAQTVAKGYHYYIKGDSGYTKYVKELNANGVFTLTSESTANAVDIVTELVAMANGNLTMTEESVAIPAWFEWKNDNVTGVDGVNSVAIAIALDGTYTITINDGERVITLSQMGEADVSAPSDDKMTLFAESLAYQNNFTWTVKAIGSQIYESMPDVSALAGATLVSATKKADGKKLSYSLTTNNPLVAQSTIQTDLRANLNGDSSKLYRYDHTQSQWLGSTHTESFIHSAIAGMQAADIAELLDVNKYTLENGTYTLKSGYTFQWKYDYNSTNDTVISTELMGVKVVVNEDSLVLTATAIVDERFTADVTYTFNGLGSTSVDLSAM